VLFSEIGLVGIGCKSQFANARFPALTL